MTPEFFYSPFLVPTHSFQWFEPDVGTLSSQTSGGAQLSFMVAHSVPWSSHSF